MKRVAAVFSFWLLCIASLHAAEVLPRIENGTFTVNIRGLEFPEALRKDLVSGLTNRMLIRATVMSNGAVVAQSVIDVAIRYDLWEESFRLTMAVDGRAAEPRTIPNVGAMTALLADLSVGGLFATAPALQRGTAYVIDADVLFDPIDRERMEKIRQWVARNSAYPSQGGSSSGTSPSADLFNRIFEQYASGAEFAAVWRQSVSSRPFRPEELGR